MFLISLVLNFSSFHGHLNGPTSEESQNLDTSSQGDNKLALIREHVGQSGYIVMPLTIC